MKRSKRFVVGIIFLLFGGVFTNATTTQEQKRLGQQRVLQATGRPIVREPSRCIPREEIRSIHEDLNDTRLPWLGSTEGSVQRECYTRNNSCGSSDGTAPSACCRVSFDAGWLVCDVLNGFDWMPCVCNDNTEGSPTPEPTELPQQVPDPGSVQPQPHLPQQVLRGC